jgi:hypothetical protein
LLLWLFHDSSLDPAALFLLIGSSFTFDEPGLSGSLRGFNPDEVWGTSGPDENPENDPLFEAISSCREIT